MNTDFERIDLGDGATLHGLETDKFKTIVIHAVFQTALDEHAAQVSSRARNHPLGHGVGKGLEDELSQGHGRPGIEERR